MPRTWGTSLNFTANDTADTFTPSTIAVVCRANAPASGAGLLQATTSADAIQFGLQVEGASDVLSLYDTFDANALGTSATAVIASTWTLVGATYPSSGGTPRFHRYRFDTAAVAHEDGDTTITAPPSVGASGKWRLGIGEGAVSWSGEIAAAGYWKGWAMSDSEFERLASGNWAATSPWFLWESSPRDTTMGWARDISRMRSKFLAQTGTTRYAGSDPPGFRYSIENRRR